MNGGDIAQQAMHRATVRMQEHGRQWREEFKAAEDRDALLKARDEARDFLNGLDEKGDPAELLRSANAKFHEIGKRLPARVRVKWDGFEEPFMKRLDEELRLRAFFGGGADGEETMPTTPEAAAMAKAVGAMPTPEQQAALHPSSGMHVPGGGVSSHPESVAAQQAMARGVFEYGNGDVGSALVGGGPGTGTIVPTAPGAEQPILAQQAMANMARAMGGGDVGEITPPANAAIGALMSDAIGGGVASMPEVEQGGVVDDTSRGKTPEGVSLASHPAFAGAQAQPSGAQQLGIGVFNHLFARGAITKEQLAHEINKRTPPPPQDLIVAGGKVFDPNTMRFITPPKDGKKTQVVGDTFWIEDANAPGGWRMLYGGKNAAGQGNEWGMTNNVLWNKRTGETRTVTASGQPVIHNEVLGDFYEITAPNGKKMWSPYPDGVGPDGKRKQFRAETLFGISKEFPDFIRDDRGPWATFVNAKARANMALEFYKQSKGTLPADRVLFEVLTAGLQSFGRGTGGGFHSAHLHQLLAQEIGNLPQRGAGSLKRFFLGSHSEIKTRAIVNSWNKATGISSDAAWERGGYDLYRKITSTLGQKPPPELVMLKNWQDPDFRKRVSDFATKPLTEFFLEAQKAEKAGKFNEWLDRKMRGGNSGGMSGAPTTVVR